MDKITWLDQIAQAIQDGKIGEAAALCSNALNAYPDDISLLHQQGKICFYQNNLTTSEAIFKRILAAHPNDAQALTNLGLLLKTTGRLQEAEHLYKQVIASGPSLYATQAKFNLANLFLMQEKWREGFAAFEARLQRPDAIPCPYPLPHWTPDLPASSSIVLWNDQGFGDAVMFVRFAKALAEKGYRLFLHGQKSLKSLAQLAPFINGALHPSDRPPALDAALPLCSLPYALGIDNIEPWSTPYLHAPPTSAYAFGEKPTGRRRIGIVWAGNHTHRNNENRSLKLAQLAPLFDVPHIDWFSLQMGREDELAAQPPATPLKNLSPYIRDFADTASIMAHLDLVITVDTAAAHLAGALGIPVWTLLPAVGGDWRWKATGDTTVWYPSMRLFRQPQAGQWTPVIVEIVKALTDKTP